VVAVGTGTVQYFLVRFWWWTARPPDEAGTVAHLVHQLLTPSRGEAVLKVATPMVLALLPSRAAFLRIVRHRDPAEDGTLKFGNTVVPSVVFAGLVAWLIATRGVGNGPRALCAGGWFRGLLNQLFGDECGAASYAPWVLATFDVVLWAGGMLAGALLVISLYLVFPHRRAAD
jgi:hypothetical protein